MIITDEKTQEHKANVIYMNKVWISFLKKMLNADYLSKTSQDMTVS